MKNIYLVFLFITTGFIARAQDTVKRRAVTHHFEINEQSVVKDSSGKQYTYQEWNKLVTMGRDFTLWPDNMDDPHTTFTLVKKAPGETNSHTVVKEINDAPAGQQAPSREEAMERYMATLPKPRESEQFTTGEAIQSFTTYDMNGQKIKLKDLRGKIVVLNFWFIGCPACMQEIPELNKLVDDYKSNPDVVFLAIALDNRFDLKKFMKTTAFNYDIIADGRFIAGNYNINLYPTSVILDKEGKVAFHTVGFAVNSPYWMKKTINGGLK